MQQRERRMYSHLGKFEAETELTAYLYQEVYLNGAVDDELGDVETFGAFDLYDGFDVPESVMYVAAEAKKGKTVRVYAIGCASDSGFYSLTEYKNHRELMRAWKELQREYDNFLAESDNEES